MRKKDIIDHVEKLNSRLTENNKELGDQEVLFQPTIDYESEYPERNFDIQDSDIDAYREKLKKDAAAAAAGKGKKGKKGKQEEEEVQEEAPDEDEQQKEDVVEKIDVMTAQVVLRKNVKVQKTDFDDEFDRIRQIELTYEREKKKEEISEIINDFDEEIREMQKEKYRLESDLKNAEMKLILFFEELILLR